MTAIQYHWVHKNTCSTSLSNTNGPESREIRRLVQHQRLSRRQQGELQIRWSKCHKWGTPNISTVTDEGLGNDKYSIKHEQSCKDHAENLAMGVATSIKSAMHEPSQIFMTVQSTGIQVQELSTTRPQRRKRHRPSDPGSLTPECVAMQHKWRVSPKQAIPTASIDPFNTTSVPVTEEVDVLMKYYATAQAKGGNAYKLHLLPTYLQDFIQLDDYVQSAWSNYLRYEHCMYAMMAFMAVRLVVITRVRLSNIKPGEHYMQKAIISLRSRVADCLKPGVEVDHATISAMNQIALADWTSGSLRTARIHLQVLSSLIHLIDTEHFRGRFMIESIRTLDVQVALETRQLPFLSAAPSFEPLSSERLDQINGLLDNVAGNENTASHIGFDHMVLRLAHDPKTPREILEDCAVTLDVRLGTKLQEAIYLDILLPSIHPTIRNVLDCLAIAKLVWRTDSATKKDARYMCRTARTMVHRLWTFGWDHANDLEDLQQRLTDCVRLALLIHLTLATNRMAARAVFVLGEELCMKCQRLRLPLDATELQQRIFLWTLVTGMLAAPTGSSNDRWLSYEAAVTASGLGIRTYEALHDAMTEFIYSWTMQMQSLQRVISSIELHEAMQPVSDYRCEQGDEGGNAKPYYAEQAFDAHGRSLQVSVLASRRRSGER